MQDYVKHKVKEYIRSQISQSDIRVNAYALNDQGEKNPTRSLFPQIKGFIDDFLSSKTTEPRWLCISGLRGVGKTTLLAQLWATSDIPRDQKLYLFIDQASQILGVSLQDILEVYEEILGTPYEELRSPVLLFLDEVQYEKNWGIILKTLYDRAKRVFIVSTGSSALFLQTNADVARRAVFQNMWPMSFTEYLQIKKRKPSISNVEDSIKTALFYSQTEEEVYNGLLSIQKAVENYWIDIHRMEIDTFLKFGTLPFTLPLKNDGLIYDQIKQILDRIINYDILNLGCFRSDVINKIPAIIYTAANSDVMSVTNLSKTFGITAVTLSQVLDILEKTQIMFRVYPYGSSYAQVRKPSKYLFTSSAFRAMEYGFIANIAQIDIQKGKLLEDIVGLYLMRLLKDQPEYSLTYDSGKGGADFIVGFQSSKIVIEVGYGKKGIKQAILTAEKVEPKYSLVVAEGNLKMDKEKKIVYVPLEYFLLL
ncbi:MAG: ATP-binding protein [Candidatus Brocadiae bacterium]|nr:ATP-binding protein [Candidatus Brocadiia bacterium]